MHILQLKLSETKFGFLILFLFGAIIFTARPTTRVLAINVIYETGNDSFFKLRVTYLFLPLQTSYFINCIKFYSSHCYGLVIFCEANFRQEGA